MTEQEEEAYARVVQAFRGCLPLDWKIRIEGLHGAIWIHWEMPGGWHKGHAISFSLATDPGFDLDFYARFMTGAAAEEYRQAEARLTALARSMEAAHDAD